jgi:hypothetical protein
MAFRCVFSTAIALILLPIAAGGAASAASSSKPKEIVVVGSKGTSSTTHTGGVAWVSGQGAVRGYVGGRGLTAPFTGRAIRAGGFRR